MSRFVGRRWWLRSTTDDTPTREPATETTCFATILQTYVHAEKLCRRWIYHSFNPQGGNIVAASLLTLGTKEQKHQWAVPVLEGERTARSA